MTQPELFKIASGGDAEAEAFLLLVNEYFRRVFGFAAAGTADPHAFISLMAQCNKVFSCAYYGRNADKLYLPVLTALHEGNLNNLAFNVSLLQNGFAVTRKLVAEMLAKEEKKE